MTSSLQLPTTFGVSLDILYPFPVANVLLKYVGENKQGDLRREVRLERTKCRACIGCNGYFYHQLLDSTKTNTTKT